MSTRAVEARSLHFRYPDGREALRGVDLVVEQGERVALLGPNGAGKTTFALHLNGIHRPRDGTVRIGGLQVEESTLPEIRRRVGMVFQDSNDQLFMPTVADDVAFGPANLGLRGTELNQRVAEALETVNASDTLNRPPHNLSGGERRRVAIATVLAMHPEVLVLDEPAAGLDPAGRREIISTLSSLQVTLIVVTHDLLLALELCERSAIMDGGRIVADGATPALLSDAGLLAAHRLEMPYGFRADFPIAS